MNDFPGLRNSPNLQIPTGPFFASREESKIQITAFWNPMANSHQRTVYLVALAGILTGCIPSTTVVSVKVSSDFLSPSAIQVPLTVGVYYGPELRTHERMIEPIANRQFVIRLGEPTIRLLDGVYPTLFTKTVAVNKRPSLKANRPYIDALLEVNIANSDFNAVTFVGGRTLLAWAEIEYRFTAYSPPGAVLASWKVRGTGERSGSRSDGLAWLLADAAALAMRDAVHRLQTSFFDVPEARRWVRGMPAHNVNVPIDGHATLNEPQASWITYPGAFAATANVSVDPKSPGVLSAKILVRNEGSRRIFVRPSDFSLEVHLGTTARPAQLSEIAAVLAPRLQPVTPLPLGPPGSLAFAAPILLTTLINQTIEKAQNRKIEETMTRYRTEALRGRTLWPGDSREFITHFVLLPGAGKPETLTVPLVDLDASTRYLVRFRVE